MKSAMIRRIGFRNAVNTRKVAVNSVYRELHQGRALRKGNAPDETVGKTKSAKRHEDLSELLVDLSKSSTILHSGPGVQGYSRPASSVVSKKPNDIFDDRKLFYGVFDSVSEREFKTLDLKQKVSQAMHPRSEGVQQMSADTEDKKVHRVDDVNAFTSNDNVKHEKSPAVRKKAKIHVKRLDDSTQNGDLNVDLDSVLSFLNKNVR